MVLLPLAFSWAPLRCAGVPSTPHHNEYVCKPHGVRHKKTRVDGAFGQKYAVHLQRVISAEQ